MPGYRYPKGKWKFPENTTVSMTTREVATFLMELGQLRQDLGGCLARLAAFEPQFTAVAAQAERLDRLERSVSSCQEACGRERGNRYKVAHWIAYTVAGIVPGAVIWYFTRHFSP
jgi:hypothetical protein